MTLEVGLIIGSLRQASYSRRLALALRELAPAGMALDELAYGDLPLYNGDLEANAPQPWQRCAPRCAPATRCCSSSPNTTAPSPAA